MTNRLGFSIPPIQRSRYLDISLTRDANDAMERSQALLTRSHQELPKMLTIIDRALAAVERSKAMIGKLERSGFPAIDKHK